MMPLFCTLLLSLTLFQQAEKPSPVLGTITGKVIADDGQPMAGATVLAFARNGEAPVSRSVNTDEEGNFKFTRLPSAAYQLVASRKGYVLHENLSPFSRVYRLGENAFLTLTKGGVIAGKVVNTLGEPVIEVGVNAVRIGSTDGKTRHPAEAASYSMRTDDRGQYRIFGLPPGRYLVRANTPMYFMREGDPHLGEKTIYYPSGGIESAQEVVVNQGEVITGIDIRYRGEQGLRISGTVTGIQSLKGPSSSIHVDLYSLPGRSRVAFTNKYGSALESFSFTGISDGQYVIEATGNIGSVGSGDVYRARRKLTVKAADLTKIQLNLIPYANIEAGTSISRLADAEFEKLKLRRTENEEVSFVLRPENTDLDDDQAYLETRTRSSSDQNGKLVFKGIPPATYRLIPEFPGPELYLKSIILTSPRSPGKPVQTDLGRLGLKLNSGDKLSGISVALAEGAASLEGVAKLQSERSEGVAPLVFLVPAETEERNNLPRFFQVQAGNDGSFRITNIEPGKYLILARGPFPADMMITNRPVAWNPNLRARIIAEAVATGRSISLQPGQVSRLNEVLPGSYQK